MWHPSSCTCHLMTSMLRLSRDLEQVAGGAVSEGRACVRFAFPLVLNPRHLGAQPFFGLVLRYGANTRGDANPEVSLVNEQSAVGEDSDAGCARRGHELLLLGGEAFSKGAEKARKFSTHGFLIRRSLV